MDLAFFCWEYLKGIFYNNVGTLDDLKRTIIAENNQPHPLTDNEQG